MSMPNPKTRFFLCKLAKLYNRGPGTGFIIQRELDGPEIPTDLDQMGHYQVVEIVRRFRVNAVVNYTTEEFKT